MQNLIIVSNKITLKGLHLYSVLHPKLLILHDKGIDYDFWIIFEIIDQCALANRDRSVTKARSIESHRALALLATTLALKVKSNLVF